MPWYRTVIRTRPDQNRTGQAKLGQGGQRLPAAIHAAATVAAVAADDNDEDDDEDDHNAVFLLYHHRRRQTCRKDIDYNNFSEVVEVLFTQRDAKPKGGVSAGGFGQMGPAAHERGKYGEDAVSSRMQSLTSPPPPPPEPAPAATPNPTPTSTPAPVATSPPAAPTSAHERPTDGLAKELEDRVRALEGQVGSLREREREKERGRKRGEGEGRRE
eukprot:jgi/Chlat1/9072/Chrsp94S08360